MSQPPVNPATEKPEHEGFPSDSGLFRNLKLETGSYSFSKNSQAEHEM